MRHFSRHKPPMLKRFLVPVLLAAAWSAQAAPAAKATINAATLYQQNCAQCHGVKREGASGPNLADATWTKVKPDLASMSKFLAEGAPATGMPAWKGVLSPAAIKALSSYLLAPPAADAGVGVGAGVGAGVVAGAVAGTAAAPADFPELKNFRLPVGFSIAVYADKVAAARSLAVAPSGVVFVGSRAAGKVYALVDSNRDNVADKVVTIAEGLDAPIGVTLLGGALYVAEISRVIRFDNIEATYASKPKYTVVKDDFPKDKWHGEKIIKASPDGKLYVPIGAPCNVCDKENAPYAKIYSMDPDGKNFEIYARGIRNSVGFAWHPVTKALWFTDNGRDMLGDNTPSDKLHVAPKAGMHFGFPYCAGGVIADPEFAAGRKCSEFTAPVAKLGPHVAGLGLAFNTGSHFPPQYRNQLFIAEHGSWNRSQKIGYRVNLIALEGDQLISDTVFVDGFLQGDNVIGRPVDIAFMADGAMLISDDHGGRVFRVSYKAPPPVKKD